MWVRGLSVDVKVWVQREDITFVANVTLRIYILSPQVLFMYLAELHILQVS